MEMDYKKLIMLCLFALLIIPTISAYRTNQPIVISQGCPNSTYSNISKIFLEEPTQVNIINSEVTMEESSNDFYEYNFSYTNYSGKYRIIGHCDIDGVDTQFAPFFEVNPSGGQANIGAYIVLIIFSIGLFFSVIWVHITFSRERMKKLYKKIVDGYFDSKHNDDKNLGKVIMFTIGYGLLKNLSVLYYLSLVFIFFILTEFMEVFNISTLLTLFGTILNIMLWGFILVFIIFIFNFYELIKTLLIDVQDSFWGVGNDFG